MPPFTRYDLPFRFERALQPDALRVVATCTIAVNDAIRFASPIKFTDGYEGQEFFVRKRGRKTALAISEHGSARYRVTNMARMAFSVVPQTKVHRTVF